MSFYQTYKKIFTLKRLEKRYSRRSFSQEGEDLIVQNLLKGRKSGFYVDVGAHHPFRFSNTYSFYLKGWHGINIDARPGSMDLFKTFRPRDINLELAISDRVDVLTYHLFNDPALNSFSLDLSNEREALDEYHIVDRREITTCSLKSVLDSHIPANTQITFMSIDVEGLDFKVLSSNDWDTYRPELLIVEDLVYSKDNSPNRTISDFLRSKGYEIKSKLINSVIFTKTES